MIAVRNLAVAIVLFVAAIPNVANACFAPPTPFDPRGFQSGVIIQGTILSSERKGRMINVTMSVERVVQGNYQSDSYSFAFFGSFGDGACPPASTQIVPNGQKLVVYLERRDAGLWRKGWMHFERAAELDYRVRIPSASDR